MRFFLIKKYPIFAAQTSIPVMNDLKLHKESAIKGAKKRYSRVGDIPASVMF